METKLKYKETNTESNNTNTSALRASDKVIQEYISNLIFIYSRNILSCIKFIPPDILN